VQLDCQAALAPGRISLYLSKWRQVGTRTGTQTIQKKQTSH